MTTYNPANPITMEAAQDFTNFRYRHVITNAAGKCALPTAITNNIMGIIQNTPETGQEAAILPLGSGGSSLIVLGATLAAGDKIATEYVNAADAGKAQAAVSTQMPSGVLLQGGAEDELGEVLLNSQTPLV